MNFNHLKLDELHKYNEFLWNVVHHVKNLNSEQNFIFNYIWKPNFGKVDLEDNRKLIKTCTRHIDEYNKIILRNIAILTEKIDELL